jgi:seryl-tRNA synthetase|tara:strand:- start:21110 stop:22375 length:1266 start_codon:yes stop_codon:yes gene_type:complete
MLDIKKIRNNPDKVLKSLKRKDNNISIDKILKIDAELKVLTTELNDLQANQNSKSKEIGLLKSKGESAEGTFSDLKVLSEKIKNLEKQQRILSSSLKKELLEVPNIPHLSSPHGADSKDNVIVHENNSNRKFNFDLKNHIDIGTELGILDFEVAAKMSGSGFPLYKGRGALLERALINFMIDYHLKNFNYTEFFTPFLVKPDSAITTGQLPKFSEDMYHIEKDDLYLIPTAEVSLTNIHKDDILSLSDLPKYYLGYSACFRREAGSYGKDTKGLLRVHQFNKVELVKFVEPKNSYNELDSLVKQATKILDMLELDYRVIELCDGDLSFAASKCFDLEVWAPGEQKWLEVSSCSNFEDFQARRGNIRYKDSDGKTDFIHTLNGSGLATPRIFAALLETHQKENGSVEIPECLQPYMGISEIK